MLTLGKALNAIRVVAGCSQFYTAKQALITRGFYVQVENDKRLPSYDTLLNICKALKVEPWQLFFVMRWNGESIPDGFAPLFELLFEYYPELQTYLAQASAGYDRLPILHVQPKALNLK